MTYSPSNGSVAASRSTRPTEETARTSSSRVPAPDVRASLEDERIMDVIGDLAAEGST